jgi:hypothetical protein
MYTYNSLVSQEVSMSVLSPVKTVTKQDFINALRSGEYEQNTDGRMQAGPKMCAMMVFHALNHDRTLSAPVGDKAIFNIPMRIYNKIAELNDNGMTFLELADILSVHLSEDFQNFSYAG